MKQLPIFSEYQPYDGKIAFLCREAFKENEKYEYNRVFSLTGNGIYTLVIDKTNNSIYEVKVTTGKRTRPAHSPIKDKSKEEILNIFIDYCKEVEVFTKEDLSTIQTYSKGITLYDEGILVGLDIVKKRDYPK